MTNKTNLERVLSTISNVGIIISIILIIVISYFSLIPSRQITVISILPFGDKGAHMLAYAVLGVFLYLSFVRVSYISHHKERDLLDSNWIILPSLFTIVLGLSFGILIEFIQKAVERNFEKLDIIANGLGLVVGCAIGFYILKTILKIVVKREGLDE